MQYEREFVSDFMHRTLAIVQDYSGEFEATLLFNCLLGLLVVPKETQFNRIPKDPPDRFSEWGLSPETIKCFGTCNHGRQHIPDLRQFVKNMRNAVAHFNIEPTHENGEVAGFSFRDRNGFHAIVTLGEMRAFVLRLGQFLDGHG
jgi:hypothetical protein